MKCANCEATVSPGPVQCPLCAGPLDVTLDDVRRWFRFSAARHAVGTARWSVGLTGIAAVIIAGSFIDFGLNPSGDVTRQAGGQVIDEDITTAEVPTQSVRISLATVQEAPEEIAEAEAQPEPRVQIVSAIATPDLAPDAMLLCVFRCQTKSEFPIGYSVRRSYPATAQFAEAIASDAQSVCEATGGAMSAAHGPQCDPEA